MVRTFSKISLKGFSKKHGKKDYPVRRTAASVYFHWLCSNMLTVQTTAVHCCNWLFDQSCLTRLRASLFFSFYFNFLGFFRVLFSTLKLLRIRHYLLQYGTQNKSALKDRLSNKHSLYTSILVQPKLSNSHSCVFWCSVLCLQNRRYPVLKRNRSGCGGKWMLLIELSFMTGCVKLTKDKAIGNVQMSSSWSSKSGDCEEKTRLEFNEIAVHRLFNIIRKDYEPQCIYVCMRFMALITTLVLCARSLDLVMSGSVRRVHVVLSTAGFKDGGTPCHKTSETAALREASRKLHALSRVQTQAVAAGTLAQAAVASQHRTRLPLSTIPGWQD